MNSIETYTREARIAYFSMEIALRADIPTYSGGLGVLAGDTLRSAADLELPMIGVTLASRAGYFRQEIDASGKQIEHPEPWDPQRYASRMQAGVSVPIEGRNVWVSAWLFVLESAFGGRAPVLLLDTDLPLNSAEDRTITHYLYGGDQRYRLQQEIVLGIGGYRMLRALGFSIRKYHMNEGHSALLALELMRHYAYPPEHVRANEPRCDLPRVREQCVFTTHTPVAAGHDKFSYDLIARTLDGYTDISILRTLAGQECLNMTQLGLTLSEYVNGVAEKHAQTSRRLFPGQAVHAITNGAHPHWTGTAFAALFDRHLPRWRHEPQCLMRADQIADEEVWNAHTIQKQSLITFVGDNAAVAFDPAVPIIGLARRMTAYKRPDLLFSDLDRLQSIARKHPLQIVLAGKAHPRDEMGKSLIETIHKHIGRLRNAIRIAYLPDYNMAIAARLVAGVDLWLNTPLRPLEASGTSGMKAAFNGIPSLSVLDGWWAEGCIEGVTGWAIGPATESANGNDAMELYAKLEHIVLPLYYGTRSAWLAVMKNSIAKNAAYFNSHRMMRRYVTEAYIR